MPPTPEHPEGTDNGNPITVTPTPNPLTGELNLKGPNFALDIKATDVDGRVIPVAEDVRLRVEPGGQLIINGGIYSFNSFVTAYLWPKDASGQPTRVAVSQTEPTASATSKTTTQGRFALTVTVPAGTTAGDYVLQVNGYSLLAQDRSVAIAVDVTEIPSIDIAGKREKSGRARVVGVTENLAPGTVVQPMIRMSGQQEFTEGTGARTVSADGTFTWQRKTSKKKALDVYFVATTPDGTVTSNTDRLKRMR